MNYQAQANQDKFVANILKFKRDGFYLDIGSCHSVSCNNTYCFESLGWKGTCVEMDPSHNDSYNSRNCQYINGDATKIDYVKLLEKMPKRIDYLSLDIDELSSEVLSILPLDIYSFNVITIEHDYYIHGDIYRNKQREILNKDYQLVCSDVLVPLQHDTQPNWSFEDWWVHRDIAVEEKLFSENMYPKDIIEKFA